MTPLSECSPKSATRSNGTKPEMVRLPGRLPVSGVLCSPRVPADCESEPKAFASARAQRLTGAQVIQTRYGNRPAYSGGRLANRRETGKVNIRDCRRRRPGHPASGAPAISLRSTGRRSPHFRRTRRGVFDSMKKLLQPAREEWRLPHSRRTNIFAMSPNPKAAGAPSARDVIRKRIGHSALRSLASSIPLNIQRSCPRFASASGLPTHPYRYQPERDLY